MATRQAPCFPPEAQGDQGLAARMLWRDMNQLTAGPWLALTPSTTQTQVRPRPHSPRTYHAELLEDLGRETQVSLGGGDLPSPALVEGTCFGGTGLGSLL